MQAGHILGSPKQLLMLSLYTLVTTKSVSCGTNSSSWFYSVSEALLKPPARGVCKLQFLLFSSFVSTFLLYSSLTFTGCFHDAYHGSALAQG